jgi:serine protease Do
MSKKRSSLSISDYQTKSVNSRLFLPSVNIFFRRLASYLKVIFTRMTTWAFEGCSYARVLIVGAEMRKRKDPMKQMHRFKKSVWPKIKLVFFSVLVALVIIAGDNLRSDRLNRYNGIQATIMNLPSVVASNAEATTPDIEMVPESFSSLAEMAGPAVVNIRAIRTTKSSGQGFPHFQKKPFGEEDRMPEFFDRFFDRPPHWNFNQRSLGSGFIIDKEGYVVTNNHVIENADEIQVILEDEKVYEAKIIGRDPNTDIALIKIRSDHHFAVVKIGDSDSLKTGQWVVAIGNPFGLENTVTAGIISAKGRILESGPYDEFIQTDASINPGNSGGPLLNMAGEVIGINAMIVAGGNGIGFAIPVNLVVNVVAQLKETGEVTRGWLGVSIQDVPNDLAEYFAIEERQGAMVADVVAGDPADMAGIRPKDVIVEVNGQKVEDSRKLLRLVADLTVGETAAVKVLRNGKLKNFQVTVAKRRDAGMTAKKAPEKSDAELGIQVADLSSHTARQFAVSETEGVILVGIKSGSRGENAGLQVGDVIKGVNREEVKNVDDYNRIVDDLKAGDPIAMLIKRRNRGYFAVQLEK